MKAALALLVASAAPASADGWLVAETPAAVAISDAQAGVFRPGVMPAVGAYADNGWFALGLRLRAGVLRDGAAPGNHAKDPGLGGLTTGSVAARLMAYGGWIEGAAGGGLTGDDLVPALEVGAGWAFDAGAFEIGPSIRFAKVASTHAMDTLGSAELVLIGVDLRFGKHHPVRKARYRELPAVPQIAADPFEHYKADRDDDQIVEREPSCAERASLGSAEARSTAERREEQIDGCTFGAITIVDDRIVLPEQVLFDLDRARVKTQGRLVIKAIAKLWAEHPEWQSITIEGHADVRGSDDYNLDLSQRRADNVRDVFVEDVDASRVTSRGFGRSRLHDMGTTEECHQRNRRVEFVIERKTEKFQ